MFSSSDHNAITPQDLIDQLQPEFRFKLDCAADESNTKCEWFYDEEANGLAQPWNKPWWCNPPYGYGIIKWATHAVEQQALHNQTGVLLLPARTDTKWFHLLASSVNEIRFFKGRLTFEPHNQVAPFPSALYIWYGSTNIHYQQLEDSKYKWLTWRIR